MTTTSTRATAIVTATLATIALVAASSPADAGTHTSASSSEPATYAPGARLDAGGPEQLLMSALGDEHVKITPLGVHLGGNGYSGGTLLR